MRLSDVIEGFVDGVKGVSLGAIILALAVTLGRVSTSLGTAGFLIRTTSEVIVPFLLPAIFMLICMLIAFAGCLRGIQCGRSAQAVGEATTSAVVTSILLIVIAASLLTILFQQLGI
jgi:hypothetical protein